MRVLVTGGAGFIGSHLVDALLFHGHEVVVLDDLSTGKKDNLAPLTGHERLRFVEGSILDEQTVEEAMRGSGVVYHLAAAVGVAHILRDPLKSILTNVRGSEVVFAEASRIGCKIVLASTSEVYGKSQKIPFAENDDRLLGPTGVVRWSYSTAKALDEHLALAYAMRGLPVVIVRYFNAYGPRLGPRGYGSVVAKFIGQALRGEPLSVHGDGRQTRCFCYVADLVRGTVLAATSPEAEGEVFNIGRDVETSILTLAETIISLTHSSSQIRFVPYDEAYGTGFEDIPRRVPNVAKAERLLGFRAETALEVGLSHTITWMAKECRNAD